MRENESDLKEKEDFEAPQPAHYPAGGLQLPFSHLVQERMIAVIITACRALASCDYTSCLGLIVKKSFSFLVSCSK